MNKSEFKLYQQIYDATLVDIIDMSEPEDDQKEMEEQAHRYTVATVLSFVGTIEMLPDEARAGALSYFGFPSDPWPGLTGPDLKLMVKGRRKEAVNRGLDWYGVDLDYRCRLAAALNREWIEGAA